jgi:hypothetical protein
METIIHINGDSGRALGRRGVGAFCLVLNVKGGHAVNEGSLKLLDLEVLGVRLVLVQRRLEQMEKIQIDR